MALWHAPRTLAPATQAQPCPDADPPSISLRHRTSTECPPPLPLALALPIRAKCSPMPPTLAFQRQPAQRSPAPRPPAPIPTSPHSRTRSSVESRVESRKSKVESRGGARARSSQQQEQQLRASVRPPSPSGPKSRQPGTHLRTTPPHSVPCNSAKPRPPRPSEPSCLVPSPAPVRTTSNGLPPALLFLSVPTPQVRPPAALTPAAPLLVSAAP